MLKQGNRGAAYLHECPCSYYNVAFSSISGNRTGQVRGVLRTLNPGSIWDTASAIVTHMCLGLQKRIPINSHNITFQWR